MSSVPRDGASVVNKTRRTSVLAVAALLFAGVFVLRLSSDAPTHAITLLYALPIALLAVELGRGWGLAAAALALSLFAVWDVTWADQVGGSPIDYLTRGAVFFVLGGFVGALADRLRRVSAQSARFWELSTDLLCTAGFDGYFKRLNPAWERTLGWSLDELHAQPFIEFVHPDDREHTEAEAARLTSAGHETFNFENRYRHKNGSYRTLLWGASAVPDEELIYATARDVTESKRRQEELRSSEQFLDSVLENLPNMVFVKDAKELRFVRFNRAGEELLGLPREELVGKSDHDLFAEQEADFFVRRDREVLASGEVVDIPEESIETAQNGSRILHTRKIAIRDELGEPRYLLGISEDITDRKAAEDALKNARAEAERANRAKSEFLSRMSHELRTPLNAVIGFGQLLELDDLDSGQREGVEHILKAGRHLLELINEVLDISRIESGTMSMSLEPVHVGSVLAEALSLIRPLADQAEVRLIADPSEFGESHARADQQRLKQVLINLLSNAVKYNRQGGEIRVRRIELPEGRLQIAITDTGTGMNDEQLKRLFAPFDRLGAESSGVEGTGLGLPLSLRLMEAMGGAIKPASKPGSGTTMQIELHSADAPQEQAAGGRAEQAAAHGPPREPRSIVYIEDNLTNLKLVERALERLPEVKLIPAMHGKLGLELAREHRPDLILLDLHLPDLQGREVLEQLRRDPSTAAIPVVVLSADATPAQAERLRTAGAAEFMTKPVDVASLLDTVASITRSHPNPSSPTARTGGTGLAAVQPLNGAMS